MTTRKIASPLLLAALAASALVTSAVGADGAAGSNRFRFERAGEHALKLLDDDRPVLVYNHGAIAGSKAAHAKPRGGYVHPVYGLEGEVLTDDFPADHVNHRGLYWAWPHVKVGDGPEVDSWNVRGIETRFGRWTAQATQADRAVLGVENGWFVGDRQVAREQVQLVVHAATDDARAIDVTLSVTPTDQPITLRGAAGKGYGGVQIRFAPRKTTVITVPEGVAKDDLVVARLPWADVSGDLSGEPGELSGAALMAHPSNRDFPPEWMTRHYGMIAAGWPGVKPQTIAKGASVTLRYRVWIHRGNPSAAKIAASYEAYRSTPSPGEAR